MKGDLSYERCRADEDDQHRNHAAVEKRSGATWRRGDLQLLQTVSEQRQRQEAGDSTNTLTQEQIALIEGLTGIKCEYEEA